MLKEWASQLLFTSWQHLFLISENWPKMLPPTLIFPHTHTHLSTPDSLAGWWPEAAFHNALDNTHTQGSCGAEPLNELSWSAAVEEQNRLTSMRTSSRLQLTAGGGHTGDGEMGGGWKDGERSQGRWEVVGKKSVERVRDTYDVQLSFSENYRLFPFSVAARCKSYEYK